MKVHRWSLFAIAFLMNGVLLAQDGGARKPSPQKKIPLQERVRQEIEEDEDALGTRGQHWSGFDLGVGVPFPALVGLQIGFNFGDAARISAGYGTTGDWGVYSLDSKFFLSKTPATGFIGIGLDYLRGNEKKLLLWELGFTSGFTPLIEAGLDYQSELGLHLCLSISAAIPSGKTILLPGLAIGWYF